jgi:hypothetical protein
MDDDNMEDLLEDEMLVNDVIVSLTLKGLIIQLNKQGLEIDDLKKRLSKLEKEVYANEH